MFCLRSWIPLLIFLTNASPLYVALFLFATYALQRPCVYCSILLFVLVFSLFDFSTNWFESPWGHSDGFTGVDNATFDAKNITVNGSMILDAAGLAFAALNNTNGTGTINGTTVDELRRKLALVSLTDAAVSGFEALRTSLQGRFQLRLPCLDAVIRL
ncbi:hypothetical protein K470DRAFT_215669 [Piedraia hortae CBS 480.64]|uniref:Uncharacterized protein n=1 Tax=Piedraia hortae CBS 480.64 TaxID=1314780 RepID=A0A6A7C1V7_9PEZI|nr:hypothetical protein K470DRAFT_215669 [Piedraia hortae CBS 480.64]